MNKATLYGKVGMEPDVKYTQGGLAIAKLKVVTEENKKDKNGEWQKESDWHTVIVFGKSAESVAKGVVKGTMVSVEGRIKSRSYEKQDGTKAYVTEILADRVQWDRWAKRDERPAPQGSQRTVFDGDGSSDELPY